ncbi:MAG: thermonuclease family protein, partial [Acidimicrobiaceae bacterium]
QLLRVCRSTARHVPFAFILLIGVCIACTGANSVQSDVATIESVIDGDTIVLRVQNQTETVRLLGVDTPETVHPSKPIECYGPEASAFTKATLAKGSTVKLLRDVEPRDRSQRLLVYLFLADGTLFNQLLIDRGFARTLSIEPNTAFASQFATHESNAKDRRVGLWQSCER